MPRELTENRRFKVPSALILCDNNEPFLHWTVTRDKTWILYNQQRWWVQWLDREEAPKPFPEPNLHQKPGPWPLVGGLLPIWSILAFWILRNPLYLRSMLCKSIDEMHQNNCMPPASAKEEKGPNSSPGRGPTARHPTNASKVEQIGLRSFASSSIFTWLLGNRLPLLPVFEELLAGKIIPQPAGGRCYPRVRQIPRHGFLQYSNKLISHWQNCVDYNEFHFD